MVTFKEECVSQYPNDVGITIFKESNPVHMVELRKVFLNREVSTALDKGSELRRSWMLGKPDSTCSSRTKLRPCSRCNSTDFLEYDEYLVCIHCSNYIE